MHAGLETSYRRCLGSTPDVPDNYCQKIFVACFDTNFSRESRFDGVL